MSPLYDALNELVDRAPDFTPLNWWHKPELTQEREVIKNTDPAVLGQCLIDELLKTIDNVLESFEEVGE